MRIRSRVIALAIFGAVAFASMHSMEPVDATTYAPHLDYYGGRVMSHVKVDIVVWSSWSYPTTVPLTGPRSISSFAAAITNSRYIDWLREYNTSSQQIGRGTLDGVFTIRPPSSANGRIVTNSQIQSVLSSAIAAGR